MRNILFILCCIICVTCCGKKELVTKQANLKLVSSVPAKGSINVLSGTQKINLVFNQPVKVTKASAIKLNEKPVDEVDVSVNTIVITTILQPGSTYNLFVPKEVITNATNTALEFDINFSFTTKETTVSASELITLSPSSQAQKLFKFLKDIYGKKTLSGTMANVSWNINEAEWVYQHTGKYPALNCFDFIHHPFSSPGGWVDYENTSVVENWWNNNGIVAAMWHWSVPKDMSESNPTEFGFYTDDTNFDVSKINDTNSPEYKMMIKDIDIISGYLKLLKEKNIPVIWRPLHEAAGNTNSYPGGTGWFWWGAKGAEPCKALWKQMFDRMTNLHELNNLIWVWTSENNDPDWYPGDEYVDMIGRDLYNLSSASQVSTEFTKLKQQYPGKPVS
ncbi:MAG: glycosyl hydrolase, partial [Bacteroidia bacterium]|nr:glycosyl hydrolase [Bacteroidia bacterium]